MPGRTWQLVAPRLAASAAELRAGFLLPCLPAALLQTGAGEGRRVLSGSRAVPAAHRQQGGRAK